MQVFLGGQIVVRSAAPNTTIWVQHSDLAVDPAVAVDRAGPFWVTFHNVKDFPNSLSANLPHFYLQAFMEEGGAGRLGFALHPTPTGFFLSFCMVSPFPEFCGNTEVQMNLASACQVGGRDAAEWLSA